LTWWPKRDKKRRRASGPQIFAHALHPERDSKKKRTMSGTSEKNNVKRRATIIGPLRPIQGNLSVLVCRRPGPLAPGIFLAAMLVRTSSVLPGHLQAPWALAYGAFRRLSSTIPIGDYFLRPHVRFVARKHATLERFRHAFDWPSHTRSRFENCSDLVRARPTPPIAWGNGRMASSI